MLSGAGLRGMHGFNAFAAAACVLLIDDEGPSTKVDVPAEALCPRRGVRDATCKGVLLLCAAASAEAPDVEASARDSAAGEVKGFVAMAATLCCVDAAAWPLGGTR